jgi:hypothetical protein
VRAYLDTHLNAVDSVFTDILVLCKWSVTLTTGKDTSSPQVAVHQGGSLFLLAGPTLFAAGGSPYTCARWFDTGRTISALHKAMRKSDLPHEIVDLTNVYLPQQLTFCALVFFFAQYAFLFKIKEFFQFRCNQCLRRLVEAHGRGHLQCLVAQLNMLVV